MNNNSRFARFNSNARTSRPAPTPIAEVSKKDIKIAPKNFCITKNTVEEVLDGDNNVIGTELVALNLIQGRVLAVRDENRQGEKVVDSVGRHYIGLQIEVEPGKDRYAQSTDSELHAQMLQLNPGDLVYIEGELKRNRNNRGRHARLTRLVVLEKAATGPVGVDASTEVPTTETVAA
jgi:hypothetical protein